MQHATTTKQVRFFSTGTQWQRPQTGEWLTVLSTRPAGASLVRVTSEDERGEMVSHVLSGSAYRVTV